MEKDLSEFEKLLGISFKNKELLKTALTHRSYRISHKEEIREDNERLEFLGDAVLNLCTSWWIFSKYSLESEGELSKKRAYLVCKETLIKIAKKLKLLDYIFLGKREEKLDLKSKYNIAGRTMEALIGAIFLEKGFEETCEKLKVWFKPYLNQLSRKTFKNYKTQLQEFLQKEYGMGPLYRVLSVSGPSHQPCFEVEVLVGDKILAKAKGNSKKSAENLAAKKALKILKSYGKGSKD